MSRRNLLGRLASSTNPACMGPPSKVPVRRELVTAFIFSRPPEAAILLAMISSTVWADRATENAIKTDANNINLRIESPFVENLQTIRCDRHASQISIQQSALSIQPGKQRGRWRESKIFATNFARMNTNQELNHADALLTD